MPRHSLLYIVVVSNVYFASYSHRGLKFCKHRSSSSSKRMERKEE